MRKRAAVLAIAACSRSAPIASCDDDLRGVYTAGDERWMILDDGATLEAYPVFPDGAAAADLVIAPRVIDLSRSGGALRGTLRRRYMRRAERCDAHVPVEVTRCAGDTLDVVLADPSPPAGFAPCAWPAPAAPRVVHWRRD